MNRHVYEGQNLPNDDINEDIDAAICDVMMEFAFDRSVSTFPDDIPSLRLFQEDFDGTSAHAEEKIKLSSPTAKGSPIIYGLPPGLSNLPHDELARMGHYVISRRPVVPTDKDIELGKGNRAKQLPGNVYFRDFVDRYKDVHNDARKTGVGFGKKVTKQDIRIRIVLALKSENRRFIDDRMEVEFDDAMKKVWHRIRERKPNNRVKQVSNLDDLPLLAEESKITYIHNDPSDSPQFSSYEGDNVREQRNHSYQENTDYDDAREAEFLLRECADEMDVSEFIASIQNDESAPPEYDILMADGESEYAKCNDESSMDLWPWDLGISLPTAADLTMEIV